MPLLKIETNAPCPPGQREQLLREASTAVSTLLGKSEAYVMVTLNINPDMLFAGERAPLAYLELKSIGLPEQKTGDCSAELCRLMNAHLGVEAARVYIEFSNAARHLWGWNSRTF